MKNGKSVSGANGRCDLNLLMESEVSVISDAHNAKLRAGEESDPLVALFVPRHI